MKWLLDTNALIHVFKLREPITQKVRRHDPSAFVVSVITLSELWYGAAKSARPQRTRAEQDAALAPFRVVTFDEAAADHCARVRAHLSKAGTPIGDRDLMIASIALANRLSVVTSNVREFSRVPGLHVEDWMTSP